MFMKMRRKTAAMLALVFALAAIPSAGGMEAQAATRTKVMETKVKFSKTVEVDTESSVYLERIVSKSQVTLGKNYYVSMDIYFPSAFMKKGTVWVKPSMRIVTGEDAAARKEMSATNKNGCTYTVKSDDIKKVGDFYKLHTGMPIDFISGNENSFPEGVGSIIVNVLVEASGVNYTGSIYFDNVSLTVDGEEIALADYEDGAIGNCKYCLNDEDDDCRRTPKVVTFTGNALTVSGKALNIKKGKTKKLGVTMMPSAKAVFKSSNKKIATVTSKGVVKGIKKGKATISVKANGKIVKVKITVS
jgi:hypothetical protein